MKPTSNPWSWFGQHIKRCEKHNWMFLDNVLETKNFSRMFFEELKQEQRLKDLELMKIFLGCSIIKNSDKDSNTPEVSVKPRPKVFVLSS